MASISPPPHPLLSPLDRPALLYVGDPMCSWCWGFSPVLDALEANLGLPVRTLVGGLATGPAARVVDEARVEFLAHHWHEVHAATGQPFDHDILQRRDWLYDTELPCMAVVAARELDPSLARPMFIRLHRAFYAEGIDITTPEPYAELARGLVPDPEAFGARLGTRELREATQRDFELARHLGVAGYPTLIFQHAGGLGLICRGYAPLERLEPHLRSLLEGLEQQPARA